MKKTKTNTIGECISFLNQYTLFIQKSKGQNNYFCKVLKPSCNSRDRPSQTGNDPNRH